MEWPVANPKDPFFVVGPALISFSGGRTSAYMLYRILCAHGGVLPDDVVVAFANTGREMPETLDFVQECASRWGVHIVWLEYNPDEEHGTAIVSHNSASRNGEPFSALIEARKILPNPTVRFCTIELKIRRFKAYCQKILGWKHWTNVIGLRADEKSRVDRAVKRSLSGKEVWKNSMPLSDAGISKRDVSEFWRNQPFDLRLLNVNGNTPDGNCDLCFLKKIRNLQSTMRRRPETASWWIEEEKKRAHQGDAGKFRVDRPSYAAMLDASERQGDFLAEGEDDSVDCNCTD